MRLAEAPVHSRNRKSRVPGINVDIKGVNQGDRKFGVSRVRFRLAANRNTIRKCNRDTAKFRFRSSRTTSRRPSRVKCSVTLDLASRKWSDHENGLAAISRRG